MTGLTMQQRFLFLLAVSCWVYVSAVEIPPPPAAEDVIVRMYPPREACHMGEGIEATLEIENISSRVIQIFCASPDRLGFSLTVDDNTKAVEGIRQTEPDQQGGLRPIVVVKPKLAWRGPVFIDRYLQFSKPTSKPIEVEWKLDISGYGGVVKSGKITISVVAARPPQQRLEVVEALVEEINGLSSVREQRVALEERYQRLSRLIAPEVIPAIQKLTNRDVFIRAAVALESFSKDTRVQDLYRSLVSSQEPGEIQSGIALCARSRILIEQGRLSELLTADDKNTKTAAVAYIGAMVNALCVHQVVAFTQDEHVPLADAASRIVLGINPKLPLHLIDPGNDPFGTPLVPLPKPLTDPSKDPTKPTPNASGF